VLQLYPNSYVLVVSHENITNNWCAPAAQRRLGAAARIRAARQLWEASKPLHPPARH
jgi:hypothetical protein